MMVIHLYQLWIEEYWDSNEGKEFLLQLEDLRNGETRVTPMYEIEFVKHSHRDGLKII